MKNKLLKIIVDVLLFFSLILSIRSWDSNLTIHIFVGITFAFLLAIHIFLNRKWLVSITKAFRAGKLSKKLKWKNSINFLLLFVWIIAILSGFLTIGFAICEKEFLFAFSRIHGVSIRLGSALIIVHVIQNHKQIGSYIKRKRVSI